MSKYTRVILLAVYFFLTVYCAAEYESEEDKLATGFKKPALCGITSQKCCSDHKRQRRQAWKNRGQYSYDQPHRDTANNEYNFNNGENSQESYGMSPSYSNYQSGEQFDRRPSFDRGRYDGGHKNEGKPDERRPPPPEYRRPSPPPEYRRPPPPPEYRPPRDWPSSYDHGSPHSQSDGRSSRMEPPQDDKYYDYPSSHHGSPPGEHRPPPPPDDRYPPHHEPSHGRNRPPPPPPDDRYPTLHEPPSGRHRPSPPPDDRYPPHHEPSHGRNKPPPPPPDDRYPTHHEPPSGRHRPSPPPDDRYPPHHEPPSGRHRPPPPPDDRGPPNYGPPDDRPFTRDEPPPRYHHHPPPRDDDYPPHRETPADQHGPPPNNLYQHDRSNNNYPSHKKPPPGDNYRSPPDSQPPSSRSYSDGDKNTPSYGDFISFPDDGTSKSIKNTHPSFSSTDLKDVRNSESSANPSLSATSRDFVQDTRPVIGLERTPRPNLSSEFKIDVRSSFPKNPKIINNLHHSVVPLLPPFPFYQVTAVTPEDD